MPICGSQMPASCNVGGCQWTQSQGMAVILCMDQWQLEASLCSACASEGITRMVNGAGCGGSSATTRGDEEKRSGSWGPK